MVWTVSLREAPRRLNGKWDFVLVYTNGTTTLAIGYALETCSREAVRRIARAEIARLTAIEAEVSDYVEGEVLDLTEPAQAPPTAAELAWAAWSDDWVKLQRLKRLVNHGLIPANDSRIATLQTSLKASWVNAYFNRISV